MSNVPEFAKKIWDKEGPTCDCCGVKIPIEEVGDMETWYEPELHSIVFRCLACKVAGKKPRGVGG